MASFLLLAGAERSMLKVWWLGRSFGRLFLMMICQRRGNFRIWLIRSNRIVGGVFVYYSKLATVLLQRPVVVELGGLVDIPIVADPRSNYYIFEPELTEMVNFFEGEITRVLLQQTFLESELARTAARLVSMEQVQGNVNSELRKIQSEIYRANQAAASSKTLEMEGAYLAHHRAYGRAHV